MKKVLFGLAMFASSLASASVFQQVIPDEIRGGPLQTTLSPKLCTDNPICNLDITLFHREKDVFVVFRSEVRVPGIKMGSPGWTTWPKINSNTYSIRFDPDLEKIINDKDLLMKLRGYYPSCATESCPNGTPRIMMNVKGSIVAEKQPNGQYRQWLKLTATPQDFDVFFLLVQSSKRIVLEMNGSQYVFE